jgi:universal stress protein A
MAISAPLTANQRPNAVAPPAAGLRRRFTIAREKFPSGRKTPLRRWEYFLDSTPAPSEGARGAPGFHLTAWHAFRSPSRREVAMTITRILVPTDFSADADAAFDYALGLAGKFDAAVHLLHVVEDPLAAGMWSSEIYTAEIAGLQVNLVRDAEARLKRSVPESGAQVSTEVRTGNAAKEILEAARATNADLMVMGTRGRTGIAHIVMGSVAERVVRLASCPVLTLKANTLRKAADAA